MDDREPRILSWAYGCVGGTRDGQGVTLATDHDPGSFVLLNRRGTSGTPDVYWLGEGRTLHFQGILSDGPEPGFSPQPMV